MSSIGSAVADHALKIATAWMDGAFAIVDRLSKVIPCRHMPSKQA
jgi:hypothetical protein